MPKKHKQNKQHQDTSRCLELKGDLQEYAKITKMLGSGQVRLVLADSREVYGRIPGRFKRRGKKGVRMNVGDVVLLSCRTFQKDVYDIEMKYEAGEVEKLVIRDEVPEFFMDQTATKEDEDNIGFMDNQEIEEPILETDEFGNVIMGEL